MPLRNYYLSFVRAGCFAGAVIVEAPSLGLALRLANALGIHPGGEVRAIALTEDGCAPGVYALALQHRNKLLSKAELAALFGTNYRSKEEVARDTAFICETHATQVSKLD